MYGSTRIHLKDFLTVCTSTLEMKSKIRSYWKFIFLLQTCGALLSYMTTATNVAETRSKNITQYNYEFKSANKLFTF